MGQFRVSRGLLLAVLAVTLAACGGGGSKSSGPSRGRLMAPDKLNAAAFSASGLPSRFGDTDPHEWDTSAVVPANYPVHGIDAARYQGVKIGRAHV